MGLSAPKSQRFLRFAIWKVASDLRFQAAISEPETLSFCGISGDLAQSTRKSLAIAIVRFWCAKSWAEPTVREGGVPGSGRLLAAPPGNRSRESSCRVNSWEAAHPVCDNIWCVGWESFV